MLIWKAINIKAKILNQPEENHIDKGTAFTSPSINSLEVIIFANPHPNSNILNSISKQEREVNNLRILGGCITGANVSQTDCMEIINSQ